jgi:hypothetical protein
LEWIFFGIYSFPTFTIYCSYDYLSYEHLPLFNFFWKCDEKIKKANHNISSIMNPIFVKNTRILFHCIIHLYAQRDSTMPLIFDFSWRRNSKHCWENLPQFLLGKIIFYVFLLSSCNWTYKMCEVCYYSLFLNRITYGLKIWITICPQFCKI